MADPLTVAAGIAAVKTTFDALHSASVSSKIQKTFSQGRQDSYDPAALENAEASSKLRKRRLQKLSQMSVPADTDAHGRISRHHCRCPRPIFRVS
ncbi:MAG: hypothetical protein JWP25_6187 [Bradyrhizobium sp.]|jgi:hypothetical protein|nr:hypothetical protein [Bradyrhizobium sp.]